MAENNESRSMAVALSICTIKEQRTIVRFLWAEGVKSVELLLRMFAHYGACTMHQRKICEWIERFKEGRTSVMDQHIQRVDAFIKEDRQLTLTLVAVWLAW
jgi:hypothetical protein